MDACFSVLENQDGIDLDGVDDNIRTNDADRGRVCGRSKVTSYTIQDPITCLGRYEKTDAEVRRTLLTLLHQN